jgi:hypothetical protein
MKTSLLPTTALGKWSVGLVISLILFFILSMAIVTLGHQTGGETFIDNLYIAVPMFLAAISGIAAFFVGLVSIFKYKEGSVLVIVSSFVGFICLIFILGEFLFPH